MIGGANIDIIGRSDRKIIPMDSNIGKVIQSYGGVGRNIAENIARMGIKVHFVSAFGDDYNGHNCIRYCESVGMDMQDCLVIKGERTSSYLAVLDDTGDMSVAINDMDILRFLNWEHLASVFKKIQKEDLLVIDTNLDKDLIERMMKEAPCPIFVDPISCEKAKKLEGLLQYVHTFKPNVYEASELSGIPYEDETSVMKMGQYFLDKGVQEVFISMGKKGVMGFLKDIAYSCETEKITVANATGAGDAFMGALVSASVLDYEFKEKMMFAQSASVCTIESDASVCPRLSVEYVNQRRKNIRFIMKEENICF